MILARELQFKLPQMVYSETALLMSSLWKKRLVLGPCQ